MVGKCFKLKMHFFNLFVSFSHEYDSSMFILETEHFYIEHDCFIQHNFLQE